METVLALVVVVADVMKRAKAKGGMDGEGWLPSFLCL